MRQLVAAFAAALALAACDTPAVRSAVTAPTMAPQERTGLAARLWGANAPAMAWDGQDQSGEWTAALLDALEAEGVTLMSAMPADVLEYCPAYARQTPETRAAFWAGFLSKLAGQESGRNPGARKGDEVGLLAIAAEAARENGCAAGLLDHRANLQCGVRIMARSITRDGAIGAEGPRGWRGAARDMLSLRSRSDRTELAEWTRRQDYCR